MPLNYNMGLALVFFSSFINKLLRGFWFDLIRVFIFIYFLYLY